MNKKLIATIPLLSGFACFIASGIIGSEITADGTLIEPGFVLLPAGYFLILIGIIAGIFVYTSPLRWIFLILLAGIVLFIIGYLSYLWVEHDFNSDYLYIDHCLNNGGRWNYETRLCEQ